MKRKAIYLNITKSSNDNLNALKKSFEDLQSSKLNSFLLQELGSRLGFISFDEEMDASSKVGAMQQIISVMDLFNGGAINEINSTIKNKIENELKKEDLDKKSNERMEKINKKIGRKIL